MYRHNSLTEKQIQVKRSWECKGTSLLAQTGASPPATQETGVRSLGWEDPLEKEMGILSSIPAWRTPWTEEPGGLQ